MSAEDRTVEQRTTESGEEMVTWTCRASEEMRQPHDFFVPVSSVHSTREGDLWVVKLELAGNFWNFNAVAEGNADYEPEKCYTFVKTTLAAMLAAEQLIGPYSLELEQLYTSASGKILLSPLVSWSEKTTGLLYIMEVIKNRWDEQDLELAFTRQLFPYMDTLGQYAEGEGGLQAATIYLNIEVTEHVTKALKKVNKMMRKSDLTPFIQPFTPVIQLVLSIFPLTFSICLNPRCPGKEIGKVSVCSQHYYCSEACRRACLRPGKAGCGLCGGYDGCSCGKALSSDWRMPYLGSAVYELTANYCSEACYKQENPSNPSLPADSSLSCLSCGALAEGGLKVRMDCRVHGFCSSQCCSNYLQEMVPPGFEIGGNCLECSAGLLKLFGRNENMLLRKMLDSVDLSREYYMRVKDAESFTALFDLINILKEFFLQGSPNSTKSLSVQTLHRSVYFLTCCACSKPVYVHKRCKKEMLTWANSPYLIRCELNLHGVCSTSCLEILREQSAGRCSICPNSAIDFAIADTPRLKTHPTLEALRRTAGQIRPCQHANQQFLSLPFCAHEACTDCLNSLLGRLENESFTCPVCLQVANLEEIFKLA